jgi:hypothetical protein
MSCTNHIYKGDYGFTATGFITKGAITPGSGNNVGNSIALAVVGRFTADGKGNITGTQTRNFDGEIVTNESYTETYSVNPDCTGNSDKKTSLGIHVKFFFVILHHGKVIDGVEIDAGHVVTFRAERID